MPHLRPIDGLFNRCITKHQVKALQGQSQRQGIVGVAGVRSDTQWEQRCVDHNAYLEGLPTNTKIQLLWKQMRKHTSFVRPLVAAAIHPAVMQRPSKIQLEHLECYKKWFTPFDLVTDDHVRLDAMLVRSPRLKDRTLPTLVYVSGNMAHMEDCLLEAQAWAHALPIQVLVYNGRGLGNSLGREDAPQDAVRDCSAAILKACYLSQHVAVYGFSLGGNLTALALEKLQRKGRLPQSIDLLISENSFCSTRKVVGAWFGPMVGALAGAWQGALGFNQLNAGRALQRTPLAEKVIVAHTPGDTMIAAGARLYEVVNRPGAANAVEVVENQPRCTADAHHDYQRHPRIFAALAAWARN